MRARRARAGARVLPRGDRARAASDPGLEERAGRPRASSSATMPPPCPCSTRLAAQDPRFADRAAEARLAFRIANWPDAERQAARSRRLTRAGAALLAWWVFPGGARSAGRLRRRGGHRRPGAAGQPGDDAGRLARASRRRPVHPSRAAGRAVDAGRSRADDAAARRPAGPVGSDAGVFRRGLRDPERAGRRRFAWRSRCKLLSESGASVVGGAEFTRGLDRLRSLFPAGEATNRD